MNESVRTNSNAQATGGARGGTRPGAGRPTLGLAGPKEKWSTRLDPVVVLWLERLSQAYGMPKAGVVEKLVQEAHRRLYDELSEEELKRLGL